MKDDEGPSERMEIEFEMSLLGADGSPLMTKRDIEPIGKGEFFRFYGYTSYERFEEKRYEFLPKNTLTIRCRIWRPDIEIPTADLCFARTRMGQEHRSFVWSIKEFSKLRPEEKNSIVLQTATKGGPSPLLTLYLIGDDVTIEISDANPKIDFLICCEISVVNTDGEKTYSNTLKQWLEPALTEFLKFPKFLTKSTLMKDKDRYLPNDTLHLWCDCEIYSGEISSREEDYIKFSSSPTKAIVPALNEVENGENSENDVPS
ncbi:uncharacterized protein NPIL_671451 [Nephila pilipes]|uniref:MATH domain-containing protein n=1 Tax=Nephila pilipes TaxID=299642 RepID=A0A8X6N375_NEPPI|nr:uncharacterized protein NPIL_671451 [Nephila pilipes]